MKKKKIFFKTAKKTIAFMLAVSTFVLNGYGLDFYKQTANVVKAEAASTDVLSGKDRNVIFANSRTDFRDESIYFAMVTRYYNGDESNDVQCWDGTQYNLNDPAWRGDFKGLIEKLDYIEGKSDWIDVRASEEVTLHAGDFALIPLGIAMELPKAMCA